MDLYIILMIILYNNLNPFEYVIENKSTCNYKLESYATKIQITLFMLSTGSKKI